MDNFWALLTANSTAHAPINHLITTFFNLFHSSDRGMVELDRLRDLCLDQATIIKCDASTSSVFTLDAFIVPRQRVLTDGTVQNFYEQEVHHHTTLIGGIAQRWSLYRKSGIQDGHAFTTYGLKTFHMVLTPGGWKLSHIMWKDEQPGFVIPHPDHHAELDI